MNKLTIVALAVLAFAGCKKSSSAPPANIVGKWYLNSTTTTYYTNNTLTGTVNSEYIAHTYYATFNADGTGVAYNSVSNVPAIAPFNFTYTKSGNTITLNFPQQVINGVTYSPLLVQGTIQTLADNNLTLLFTPPLIGNIGASEKQTQYFEK